MSRPRPSACRMASPVACRTCPAPPFASCGPCADGQDAALGVRSLRLLPADLPDLAALGRGDGHAARADLPDGGARRREDGALAAGDSALRPLPRLHGVRHLVPVGREVRPPHRVHESVRRGAGRASAGRAAPARRRLRRPPASRAGPAPRWRSSRWAAGCRYRERCVLCSPSRPRGARRSVPRC